MRREGLLTGYKGMLVDRCEYVMDECGNAWICFVQDSVLSHRCVEVHSQDHGRCRCTVQGRRPTDDKKKNTERCLHCPTPPLEHIS